MFAEHKVLFPFIQGSPNGHQSRADGERHSLAHKVGLESSVVAVLVALKPNLVLLVLKRPADNLLDDAVAQAETGNPFEDRLGLLRCMKS